MANGDAPFAASTAPLTFQSFLEKMRHPSASELVKSIKARAVPISPPARPVASLLSRPPPPALASR